MSADRRPPSQAWADHIVFLLPAGFDIDEGACVKCGGSLDTGWECGRCGADHFPAVQRLLRASAQDQGERE